MDGCHTGGSRLVFEVGKDGVNQDNHDHFWYGKNSYWHVGEQSQDASIHSQQSWCKVHGQILEIFVPKGGDEITISPTNKWPNKEGQWGVELIFQKLHGHWSQGLGQPPRPGNILL